MTLERVKKIPSTEKFLCRDLHTSTQRQQSVLYFSTVLHLLLVSIKFGLCSFEAAVAEWLVLWIGTDSTRVRIPSR